MSYPLYQTSASRRLATTTSESGSVVVTQISVTAIQMVETITAMAIVPNQLLSSTRPRSFRVGAARAAVVRDSVNGGSAPANAVGPAARAVLI
jgi:hypothetical protein